MGALDQQCTAVPQRGVFVKTFGCQMNEYDTEKVVALLSDGHTQVQDIRDASVVFINTCSVREKGEHKLHSLLGTLRAAKKENPNLVVGVGGCVAQQEGENIIRRHPIVDFVVGTHNLSLVPALVSSAQRGLTRQVAIDYRDEWEDLPDLPALPDSAMPAFSSPRALIAIQRGCNKNCAFCVVPNTRGTEVSRHPDEIEREIRLKVRMGAKEVMLLGQTVNSYGRDLSPRYPFEKLVARLAEIPGLRRIRFTSPHPAEVRPEFIELYGAVPQLCPHIHLPLQSGSDRILKLMNRNYRTARYLEIVSMLRDRLPAIALSTDIIVGFPAETEEDFEQTLNLLREVRFGSSYSFKYSIRPNTLAAESFTNAEEIPEARKSERLARLQDLQEGISAEINREMLGQSVQVLVEEPSKNISSLMRGRIPENTLFEVEGGDSQVGDLIDAVVEYTSAYGMRGRVLTQESNEAR